jgi:hypothetical protein
MVESGFNLAWRRGAARIVAVVITILTWLLSASLVWPQDTGQQAPTQQQTPPPATNPPPPANSVPPGPVNPIGSEEQSNTAEQPAAPPSDTRPVAGAQELTPTLPGSGRSYLIPSFSDWTGADSDAQIVPGHTQYLVATIPLGSLDLNYSGRRNQFNLDYGGGGVIYPTESSQSAAFDQLTFSDYYDARRWNLLVMNRAAYLPQASLGFGGFGYAGAFNTAESLGLGSGVGQLNQTFVPGQSLLFGRTSTTNDNAVVQAQYFLTPRTSISGVASYGIQHYQETSLFSGNDRIFVGSIDHQLTGADTLTFAYDLIEYRYNGGSAAINDNVFQLGFAHRVSSRLTVTAIGGPAVIYTALAGVTGSQQQWTWQLLALAAYRANRGSVSVSYLHYATPGSGLFQGAQTQSVTTSFARELTRTWRGTATFGYSRNTRLGSYSLSSAVPNPGPVNDEVATLRLDRTLGHYLRFFGVYSVIHQRAATAIVPGYSSNEIFRQIFGIGFELHPRPLGL